MTSGNGDRAAGESGAREVGVAPLRPYPAYKPSGVEWLGDIPTHWSLQQLGRIGSFSKGSGGTKDDEVPDGIPCIRYGDLYTRHEYFVECSRAAIDEQLANGYAKIEYGDVLFAGSGETIDDIGKSAVNLIAGPACAGGDVIIFRPWVDVSSRFMGYACGCAAATAQKARMGKGITIMHIYASDLRRLLVLLPTLSEQAAVVDYLDRATADADAAIARAGRQIELLKEYRTRLIADVVTGQFDVRTGRPYLAYKSSGVEWLGVIPEHWEVGRLRSVSTLLGGATPQTGNSSYWGGHIPWLTPEDLGRLGGRQVQGGARSITDIGYESCGTVIAPAGSLVVSTRAPVGYLGVLDRPACCNQGCRLIVPNRSIDTHYLYFELCALRPALVSLGRGTTFAEISRIQLGGLKLCLPPLSEQAAIVDYLDGATVDTDAAIARAGRQVEVLKEYRTRLIADVVTGKIDVREAAI